MEYLDTTIIAGYPEMPVATSPPGTKVPPDTAPPRLTASAGVAD
jgi:hypothetical protein